MNQKKLNKALKAAKKAIKVIKAEGATKEAYHASKVAEFALHTVRRILSQEVNGCDIRLPTHYIAVTQDDSMFVDFYGSHEEMCEDLEDQLKRRKNDDIQHLKFGDIVMVSE